MVSYEVIVNLIGHTTTQTGLHVRAELDTHEYQIGKKVTDEDFASVRIELDSFHGEWNYTIIPRSSKI